jgi:hypothetical protein
VQFFNVVLGLKLASQRGDRHPARDFARGVAAHAVGHDHHVVDLLGVLGHIAGGELAMIVSSVRPSLVTKKWSSLFVR